MSLQLLLISVVWVRTGLSFSVSLRVHIHTLKSDSCSLQWGTKERWMMKAAPPEENEVNRALLLRLFWFIERSVVVPGAWGGECILMSHPGLAITVAMASPGRHYCLKSSSVFRDCSAGVFIINPSLNWVRLDDFSHLHYSSSADKRRICCLQPSESTAPGVQGKGKLKCQWVAA